MTTKLFGALVLLAGLTFGSALWAADTQPAAKPACCGESCKTMGDCCKADTAGKVTCSMDGKCCSMKK